MKIQHYFTLLVLATVITLIGAAEWTQSKKTAAHQREAFYSNLSHQASSFEQTLKSRIENLRYQLAQAASRHTDQISSLSSESAFSAIAWLQKNPEGAASKYKAVWAEANTQSFDPTWLKGLNFSQVKDGETFFVRRVDRNGNAFFALVMTAVAHTAAAAELPEQPSSNAEDRIYLFAALSPSTLSSWVDEWVGSSKSAFIFDEQGNVVAHSQRQYSGTNLRSDKFVNSSIRSGRGKLVAEFSDLENENRVGESLRIGQTNLRAAVSVPKTLLFKPAPSERSSQRNLMIVVGLFLVGLTHIVGSRVARKLENARMPAPFPTQTSVGATPLAEVTLPQDEPQIITVAAPEPELTFEDVEQKTRLNLEEILARSAEIRQRLQVDFIDSVESEQKIFFEELSAVEAEPAVLEAAIAPEKPKVKVRRPKVSL